jgi:hypothetical protein
MRAMINDVMKASFFLIRLIWPLTNIELDEQIPSESERFFHSTHFAADQH